MELGCFCTLAVVDNATMNTEVPMCFLIKGFPDGFAVKNPPAMQETQAMQVRSLGGEDPLEEEMVTCSSTLTWTIPWAQKPGGPQFKGLQRGGHN